MHVQRTTRRRYSRVERQAWVGRYRESTLTQADFAREHGLKVGTLRRWLYREPSGAAKSGPVFEEVALPEGWLGGRPAVEIGVGSEITIRLAGLASPEFLGQLIRHLRLPC